VGEIPAEQPENVGYEPPTKNGKGKLIGGLVVALAVVAGAIFMLTRSGGSSDVSAPPNAAPAMTDSARLQSTPGTIAALPAVTPESAAAIAPKIDSQATADSIKKAAAAKKAAAKADSLKKVAVAADSTKRAQGSNKTKARSAAIWLFADANARQAFSDGATHMGGVLGKKRMGDLQTQINTLQPFLTRAGLTYDQFKAAMQESGIKVYDEFGRIMPDSLMKFTGVNFGGH
jgi:hypothetical protein